MTTTIKIIIILLLTSQLQAQVTRGQLDLKIDSLIVDYKHFEGTEKEEYLHLKEIIKNTVDINMDTAVHYYNILDSIATQSSDSTIIMEAQYLGGVIYIIDYKPRIAKPLIQNYIKYCTRRGDHANLGKSHRFMGAIHSMLTEYEEAIFHSLRAQEFISKDNYTIQFNNLTRIARSYVFMGQLEKAIESWHWYINNIHAANENYLARVYANISDIYLDMQELDSAIIYTDKFNEIVNRLSMTIFILKGKVNQAEIHLMEGDILKAGILAQDPFDYFRKHPKNQLSYLKAHKVMAEVAIFKRETSKAKQILIDGLRVANERKWIKYEIYFTKSLLKLEVSLKSKPKTVALMDSLDKLNERFSEESKKQSLYTIHKKYDVDKKDLEIDLLKTKNELEVSKNEKAQRNIWFAVSGLLSLALISFLLLRSLSEKKKSEKLLKEKNNIISTSLSEKELLLKEIHHRVKNNLQVVSSLLSLQSEYIKDDAALSAINEGRNRVRSMALIHQNLYSEDNLTGINVKSYFEKLIAGLFESYNIKEEEIQLELQISDIELDVDIVVPLGLIANELVSNALKHAFTEQKEGLISVSLKEENSTISFIVKDNGKGMETKMDIEEMESFGYQMIYAFIQKLQADLSIDSIEGTTIQLTIKNYKKAGS